MKSAILIVLLMATMIPSMAHANACGDAELVFLDYQQLRTEFADGKNIGDVGAELIGLRSRLLESLDCDRVLMMDTSMANMQIALLFITLSYEIEDVELSERLVQIAMYYGGEADRRYAMATTSVKQLMGNPIGNKV
jgi:hypothetical protein